MQLSSLFLPKGKQQREQKKIRIKANFVFLERKKEEDDKTARLAIFLIHGRPVPSWAAAPPRTSFLQPWQWCAFFGQTRGSDWLES